MNEIYQSNFVNIGNCEFDYYDKFVSITPISSQLEYLVQVATKLPVYSHPVG